MTSFTDMRWEMEKYDLKGKLMEIIHCKEQREQRLKENEQHLRVFENICNECHRKRGKKGEDKNEEIMSPNYFSQLIKTSNLHTYTHTHSNQTAEIKKQ